MSSAYNGPQNVVTVAERRAIIERVLGQPVAWNADGEWGYTECPGVGNHNNRSGRRDCRVWAVEKPNGMTTLPPGLHCLHTSCSAVVEEMNHRIRSEIGKAKVRGTGRPMGASSGSSGKSQNRTDRTPENAVSEKRGVPINQFRTDRTGISKALTLCARGRAHPHVLPEVGSYPSGASGVASAKPQPSQPISVPAVVVTPVPPPTRPPEKRAVEKSSGAVEQRERVETTLIIGDFAERGEWVNGEWVTIKKL
jgi:hypothetical protein